MNGWIVDLSNGERVTQQDVEGEISAWWRLKRRCDTERLNILKLYMQLDGQIVLSIDGQHRGYWQAQKAHIGQFEIDDPAYHWRGIGYVDEFMVHCMWIARPGAKVDMFPNTEIIINPLTQQPHVLSAREIRFAPGEAQIVWSNT